MRDGGRGGFWAGFGLGAGGEAFDLRDGSGYSDDALPPDRFAPLWRHGQSCAPARRRGPRRGSTSGARVETLSSFLFTGQLYPAGNAGLYLKGGLGLGRTRGRDQRRLTWPNRIRRPRRRGLRGPVGRHVFLVPSVDLVQQWYSERDTAGYRERLLNFGLGIVFQTGR